MRTELHALARARGIQPDEGSRCQLCGESPYGEAGPAAKVLGKGFSDYAWLHDLKATAVCRGCASLLSGRPGDDPPPVRMWSFILDGELRLVRPKDLWPYLVDPPDRRFLLSWAVSGKIHHWIRANWSSAAMMHIGHDRKTIEYVPDRDRGLLDAVGQLLYSPTGTGPLLSRTAIREGGYHPKAIEKFGAAAWHALEERVAPHRPSLLLDLVCACAPITTERARDDDVIDPHDAEAAEILADIAGGSDLRRSDGKMFWGGHFSHKAERFRWRSLSEFISRMMEECETAPTSPEVGTLLLRLRGMSEEATEKIEESINKRISLLVALSYEIIRRRRETKA